VYLHTLSLEQIVYSATVNKIQRSEGGEVGAYHVRSCWDGSNNIMHFVGVVFCNYRLMHGQEIYKIFLCMSLILTASCEHWILKYLFPWD